VNGEVVAIHFHFDESVIPVVHRRIVRVHVAEAPTRPAADDFLLDRFLVVAAALVIVAADRIRFALEEKSARWIDRVGHRLPELVTVNDVEFAELDRRPVVHDADVQLVEPEQFLDLEILDAQ